jgi:uncharacterized membrane protein (DUF2068 family)
VASVELIKGFIAVVIGIGVASLSHSDTWDDADRLLRFLHINEDWHIAQRFLDWADNLTPGKIWAAALLILAYACLRFVEGYGLWFAKIWAEWLAIVSGALYLPFEIIELHRRPTWLHITILVVNSAIVLYMIYLRTLHKDPTEFGGFPVSRNP